MKTLDEYAVLIAERVHKQFDVAFREQCKDRLKYWRSTLVKEAIEKNPNSKKYFTQTIYMPMEDRLDTDCTGIDCIPTSTTISVSKFPVPQTVRSGKIYEYLGAINGKNPYMEGTAAMGEILSHGRFPIPVYWKWNAKVAVNKASIPMVMIQDVFEDPEVARMFECIGGNGDCTPDESWIFPISGDIAQKAIQAIYQIDFGLDRGKEQKIEIVTSQMDVNKKA